MSWWWWADDDDDDDDDDEGGCDGGDGDGDGDDGESDDDGGGAAAADDDDDDVYYVADDFWFLRKLDNMHTCFTGEKNGKQEARPPQEKPFCWGKQLFKNSCLFEAILLLCSKLVLISSNAQ